MTEDSQIRIKGMLSKMGMDSHNNVVEGRSTQEMVKKMRKLSEEDVDANAHKDLKTKYDQSEEEDKFRKNFEDLNVTVDFVPLKVYDDYIFWGGTIDGIIQFVYKVTPNEATSDVIFNYLEDFSVDNPDNDEIVKKVETYYDQFYQYWRDNIFKSK